VDKMLQKLEEIAAANTAGMAAEKRAGKPLVVYCSSFIPAELIRASGANTYLLCRGGDAAPANAALEYTLECINPLARASAGYLINGLDDLASMADLVVTANSDSHMCRMSELLEHNGIQVFKIGIPLDWQEKSSFDYYLDSLHNLLRTVEHMTGHPVDMSLAREHFALSNRVKACMARVNELRRGDSIPIGIESVMRLHAIAPLLTQESQVRECERFIQSLSSSPALFDKGAPRLLVIARAAASGDYEVMRLFDESGCPVVAEVFDECACAAGSEIPLDGDLLESFARQRYLNTLPISTFHPSWKERFQHVRSLIQEYHVDGVLWYQLACDEVYDMEFTCVSRWLSQMKIPALKLETDFDYSHDKTAARKIQINRFILGLKGR
jgi:benzoyl-CoA reductase/2-hydroxyglutaryl-CoA dehydratase subunit BcrC/BadD/HgdB